MTSIAAGAPFGFGLVLVSLSVFNYLIDAYLLRVRSAANSFLRSVRAGGSLGVIDSCVPGVSLGPNTNCILTTWRAHSEALPLRPPRPTHPCTVFNRAMSRKLARRARLREANAEVKASSAVNVESDSKTGSLSRVPSAIDMRRRASLASRISGQLGRTATQYEENPYDIGRINTCNSTVSRHRQKD